MSRRNRTNPEDHSAHHELDDADGLSLQESAAGRWKAVEAFNRIPGLSPAARRVGIDLICAMDTKTRRCFPGELRLAGSLNMWPSAIKKAKAELKRLGLISWTNPGGPRHQSHYEFDWHALQRYAAEAKKRAEIATVTRKFMPFKQPPQRTMDKARQQPLERSFEKLFPVSAIQSPQIEIQRPQIDAQQPLQRPANNLTRGPELSHEPPTVTTQHNHAIASEGGMTAKADASKGVICHYPKLFNAFDGTPDIQKRILQLSDKMQHEASKTLAMEGKEIARAYITESTRSGNKAEEDMMQELSNERRIEVRGAGNVVPKPQGEAPEPPNELEGVK